MFDRFGHKDSFFVVVVRNFYLVKHPIWLVANSNNVFDVLISHLNDAKLNSKEKKPTLKSSLMCC